MKNKHRLNLQFYFFIISLIWTAWVIWFLHHLLTGLGSDKFLIGGTFVLLVIGFIEIFWTFRKWRESRKGKE